MHPVIPVGWAHAASAHGVVALRVGLAVWQAAASQHDGVVRLDSAAYMPFGLDSQQRYRGLRSLEQAGLLTILESGPGRAPLVQVREPSRP